MYLCIFHTLPFFVFHSVFQTKSTSIQAFFYSLKMDSRIIVLPFWVKSGYPMKQPLTFKDGVKKENKKANKPLNHNQAPTRAIEAKQKCITGTYTW